MAGALLSDKAGAWLSEKGWVHVSIFGGAELGCPIARRVTDLASAPETLSHVRQIADDLGTGLADIAARHPYLIEIRQLGLIIGLKFDHPSGGAKMMRAFYEHGVWAIFAGFDRSILQFKPGIFLSEADCGEILGRLEDAIIDVAETA